MVYTVKLVRLDGGRGHAYIELDDKGNVLHARWIPPRSNIQVEL